MKNYLAPMEGVTNWVYRNAYHDYFYPMDKYFTPFITANLINVSAARRSKRYHRKPTEIFR